MTVEPGYTCFNLTTYTKLNSCTENEPSYMVINETCGDGTLQGSERCDSAMDEEDLLQNGCTEDC